MMNKNCRFEYDYQQQNNRKNILQDIYGRSTTLLGADWPSAEEIVYQFNEEITGNEEVKEIDFEKWFDTIFNRYDCTMWRSVLAVYLFLCRAEVLYPSCRRRRYRLLQMGIYSPRHTETNLFARLTFLLGIGVSKCPMMLYLIVL